MKKIRGSIIKSIGLFAILLLFAGLPLVLLMTAGCTSPVPPPSNLEQAAPRKVAKNLRLPDAATLGPVIPGLNQGAVPQGMSYWPEKDLLFTSHYFDSQTPSRIVSMDWKTGKALHTVKLQEPDGQPHYGHVGGIVIDASDLWMASDAFLYRYDLKNLTASDAASATARFKTEATLEVAFCAAHGGKIWAGEFALDGKYPTDPTHDLVARDGQLRHGWICGYDPAKGFATPEQILSIPDRAQGMAATDDFIFLSRSYGRGHRSSIEIFRNPLGHPPHQTVKTSQGDEVPLWFLDGKNHVRSIDLPPMAENVALINGKLTVLFESGAKKFRWFGKNPLDHILLLNLPELAL